MHISRMQMSIQVIIDEVIYVDVWTSKMQIIFNNLRCNKDQNVHANQDNLQEYRQLNHFILSLHSANYKKFSHSLTLQNKNKNK